jgi:ABC-type sugar transport system ATPase subunit
VVQPEHGNFVAAPGWVFRLWRIEAGDRTIWGFMQTPEDRRDDGILLAESILSNISIG